MYALRRTATTLAGKRRGHRPITALLSGPLIGEDAARGLRRAHTPRPLPYNINDGLGDFLSPEALRIIAHDYQQGLLQRLNEEVAGKQFHFATSPVLRWTKLAQDDTDCGYRHRTRKLERCSDSY